MKGEPNLNIHKGDVMKIRSTLLALVVLFTASAFAADATSNPRTGNAAVAFERFKSLAGQWEGDTNMGKTHLSYELTSGGHVLLEHLKVDSRNEEMITTYYLDGDYLALTHYCQIGNQPHMVARKIDLDRGEIAFALAGASNLASDHAAHMHAADFHLVDADHFTNSWTLFDNGVPKFTLTAQYTRVK